MNKEIKNQGAILNKLKIESLNSMQKEVEKTMELHNEIILLSPTGSGKTLAFLLPIITRLNKKITGVQALIIVPSRELAIQIEQVLREMGAGYKVNALYGGRSGSKDKIDLNHPPTILIGTPGRIASHIYRETFQLDAIETLVLDEFDKSLEIGFDDEMIEILDALPHVKNRILTSATYGLEIPDFVALNKPVEINFLKEKKSKLEIKTIKSEDKLEGLVNLICFLGNAPGIIFCNYKDSIQEVSEYLKNAGIKYGIFHGGMEQKDRERALIKFRNGTHELLIATDLAARGIDIPDLKFIVHYQIPHKEEEFIHRNGRTARMHKEGTAYVLLNAKNKLPDFIDSNNNLQLKERELPSNPIWSTLFVSGGRKDKISKGDLAGLFFKQGKLQKEELGIIELKQDCAFVAVHSNRVKDLIMHVNNSRLKKKKVRISLID